MDGYHVALFIHLCALIGAIATATIVHLATLRRDRAETVARFLEWHSLILSVARGFPIALVTFVLSGSYMVNKGALIWSSGFINAGLTGVVLLFVIGITLSIKGRALKQRLQKLIQDGGGNQPPNIPRDRVAEVLQNIPLGIVVAVMFDMTTKPAVGSAMGVLGLGIAVGAIIGLLYRPAPAASRAPAQP